MSKIDKQHIELLREYFLSQNENARQNIKNGLPDFFLKYLYIIEDGFKNKLTIENIASQINAPHLIPELQQLQTGYLLLEHDFEREIAFAIRETERTGFKKKFQSIDAEEEFQLQEPEIKSAVTQVERDAIKEKLKKLDSKEDVIKKTTSPVISIKPFIKYAAAAAIIGIVFWGGYLIINNNGEKQNTGFADYNGDDSKSKYLLNTEITPNLPAITDQVSEKKVLVPVSFGFAKKEQEIIFIVIQNVEKQIDTLKKIYSDQLQGRTGAGNGPVAKAIRQQIDSLSAIKGAYTYGLADKKIILRLGNGQKADEIISLDPSDKSKLFIKIGKSYFQLKPTKKALKLPIVTDKATIDELEKIIFQNS